MRNDWIDEYSEWLKKRKRKRGRNSFMLFLNQVLEEKTMTEVIEEIFYQLSLLNEKMRGMYYD